MFRHHFVTHAIFALMTVALVACGAPERDGPTSVDAPTVAPPTVAAPATVAPTLDAPTAELPTAEPPIAEAQTPAAAPLSFTPTTYTDASAGFALDYPAAWTLDPNSQVGMRGGQALLLSPGTTVEALADGGTRVSITTYLWDPKGDLDAYAAQRKIAWEASGFPITREESWQLPDGRAARIFVVESPDVPVFYLLTTVGDDYLQIGGEGDLVLVEEVARTLR